MDTYPAFSAPKSVPSSRTPARVHASLQVVQVDAQSLARHNGALELFLGQVQSMAFEHREETGEKGEISLTDMNPSNHINPRSIISIFLKHVILLSRQ